MFHSGGIGALQRKNGFHPEKSGITDLAENLPFGTIIFVKKWFRSTTAGTTVFIWDITLGSAVDGTDFLTVTFFKVRNQLLISPGLTENCNERKLISFEFLVLWKVGIIKSPLPERNVSADKRKKITNHSLLVLNVVK